MLYDFNLLVSHEWSNRHLARREVILLLREFGDDNPLVRKTMARGITGVRTSLQNRDVIRSLVQKYATDPLSLQFTLKWTPVDVWCEATMDSMRSSLSSLRGQIGAGERWMMHVEKRRHTRYHKAEVIRELAELIDEKVDLRNPEKIVWIEMVGDQAGMAVVRPEEILSPSKMRRY